MKNFVIMAASLMLWGGLAGCENQQDEVVPIDSITAWANSGNDRPRFNGNDCVGTGGNCLPEVVVHPHRMSGSVTAFDNIMSDGSAVGKYFSGDKWQTMFPHLATKENHDLLKALRSGKYYFIKHHSIESGKTFYIGGHENVGLDNHSIVIPVIEK